MLPTIDGHVEFPSVSNAVLNKTDPETRDKVLADDDLWKQASEAENNTQTETEETTESTEETTESTEETTESTEETTESTEETTTEELSNPFKNLGMSDEVYAGLVKEKVIRDGKIHNKYGPEDAEQFWKYYINDSKFRGKLGQELGDKRKENEKLEEKVSTTQEELLIVKKEANQVKQTALNLEEQLKGIETKAKSSNLLFDGSKPSELSEEQHETVKNMALDQTREDVIRKFNQRGVQFPESEDDWNELRLENNDLFALADGKRDQNYNKQITWALTTLQMNENYNDILRDSFLQSGYDLVENVQDMGFAIDEDTPEIGTAVHKAMTALNKELVTAEAENRLPDPIFFKTHPLTGHAILKKDAIANYIALKDRAAWSEFQSGKFTFPESEEKVETATTETTTETTTQEETSETILADVLETFGSYLKGFGIEAPTDSQEVTDAVTALADKQDNPLYWDNGELKKDALVLYFNTEQPTFIPGLVSTKLENDLETKSKEMEKQATEALLSRQEKANDTVVTAAAGNEGLRDNETMHGDTFKLPPAEDVRNPFKMNYLAKQLDIEVDELFDMIEMQVKKLSPDIQIEYNKT